MGRTTRVLAAGVGAFGIAAAIAIAAPSNGNFETGDFSGWKTLDQEGSEAPLRSISKGKWQVYKNKLRYGDDPGPPRRGIEPKLAAPPQGTYAAGLASRGPGVHILHRKITVSGGEELSLRLAYNNTAEDFVIGDGFNPDGGLDRRGDGGPNQQLRVDIMEPDAPLKSLNPAHIVQNVFSTQPGDDLERDYFKLATLLDDGQYRLRIAEVDNLGQFLVGVDAVKLKND